MLKKLTTGAAAFAMIVGAAMASDHHLWLEDAESQAVLRDAVGAQPALPWTPPADFAWEVGQVVPPQAPTLPLAYAMPEHPEAEHFAYVTHDDQVVVVDRDTGEIVNVIPIS